MARRVAFKQYHQHQPTFLPPSLEELVPAGHLVRTVNRSIEAMDLASLIRAYPGGGASSYHPEMLLKVIAYAYTQRIYSSRQIAKALRENIHFQWLSGGNRPDFRTINRFRSSRLKGALDEVFTSLIEILTEAKLVRLQDYFLDGTKIEANANKYSFVWKKAVQKNKTGLRKKVKDLLQHIDEVEKEENDAYGDKDLEEMGEESEVTPELIRRKVKELNERLKKLNEPTPKKPKSRKVRALAKATKTLEEDCLTRLERYEQQEATFGSRNSFSKTDTDATFMRMKEDHMRNGQLKAGYNVQMGTERRYILHWSIHHRPTDTATLPEHLRELKERLGRMPDRVIADAGYGSEANYEYLESEGIDAYVKYNQYDLQQTRSFRKQIFRVENLPYDPEHDRYTCPAGGHLTFVGEESSVSENGYRSRRRVYEAENCDGCAVRDQCHKSQYNRRIRVSHRLAVLQARARERLDSDEGQSLRRERYTDVETVFAQIKHNRGFRRFFLRSRDKVHIEYGLVSLAHNLANLHNDPRRTARPN